MQYTILPIDLDKFHTYLSDSDISPETVKKYVRDIRRLGSYLANQSFSLTQSALDAYIDSLQKDGYSIRSINSAIAGIRAFCRFIGRNDLECKSFNVRRKSNLDEQMRLSVDEYMTLIHTAQENENYALAWLIQIFGTTQIRVNELQFLTVEALEEGVLHVMRAGAVYDIYLSEDLIEGLLFYADDKGIERGMIFTTRSGAPMDRRNIWRALKQLAEQAGVDESKVSLQNLKRQLALPKVFSGEANGKKGFVSNDNP